MTDAESLKHLTDALMHEFDAAYQDVTTDAITKRIVMQKQIEALKGLDVLIRLHPVTVVGELRKLIEQFEDEIKTV